MMWDMPPARCKNDPECVAPALAAGKQLPATEALAAGGMRDFDAEAAAAFAAPYDPKPQTCAAFVQAMQAIRLRCSAEGTVPLYHYTAPPVAPLILAGGLRMSMQGQVTRDFAVIEREGGVYEAESGMGWGA